MKCNVVRASLLIISFVALLASFSPAADADNCSTATVAGNWGVTLTGTLLLPTAAVPGAAVATLNADTAGNVTGTEARNVGGGFANETINGSWTVNSDCTGVITATIYESGVLVRTVVLSLVFDDNSTEIRMLQQSLTLPNGTAIPVVITVQGKKMFTHGDREH
jgi:heme A synthase